MSKKAKKREKKRTKRRRASADKLLYPSATLVPGPRPIVFPPAKTIPIHPPLEGDELRNFVAHCIARTIYRALDIPDVEIIAMGEEEFEAFCRKVLEDEAE